MAELQKPESASTDENAREIARIWAAHGKQIVVFDPNLWDDPSKWGIFLVDLMKHIANSYHELRGSDKAVILNRIREGFDAEWSFSTDDI